MAPECHHIGLLSRKTVVNHNLATAGLVHHRSFHPVSEGAFTVGQQNVHVLDETAVPDFVVGDVVLYVLDAAVVADGDVMQRGLIDAGVLGHSSGQIEALFEDSQAHIAREPRPGDMVR